MLTVNLTNPLCKNCFRQTGNTIMLVDESIQKNSVCFDCAQHKGGQYLKRYLVCALGEKQLGFKFDTATGVSLDIFVHLYNNGKIGVGANRVGFNLFDSLDQFMGEKQSYYFCEKVLHQNWYDTALEICLFFEFFFKSDEFYNFIKQNH